MTGRALGRAIARSAAPSREETAERCELCGEPVPGTHSHVLDERAGEPLCSCRACALLFEPDAAAEGRYRLIPDRRIRLSGVSPADLGAPVGLAFFVTRPDGSVDAHYPSPLGATRWDVDPDVWARAVQDCPPLRTLRPSVEALLVNTSRDADEQWLVPVDECHRLVAVVRRHWKGLSGGRQVWERIDDFFAELPTR